MPLTLTFTEGALPQGAEHQVIAKLTDSMLKWHGLTGNKAMTPPLPGKSISCPRAEPLQAGRNFQEHGSNGRHLHLRLPHAKFRWDILKKQPTSSMKHPAASCRKIRSG